MLILHIKYLPDAKFNPDFEFANRIREKYPNDQYVEIDNYSEKWLWDELKKHITVNRINVVLENQSAFKVFDDVKVQMMLGKALDKKTPTFIYLIGFEPALWMKTFNKVVTVENRDELLQQLN